METRYNVVCFECGQIWTPRVNSSLWWQAKQRAEKGYLDALHVNGEQCGCHKHKPVNQPEAPYRVTGYDDMCIDFDLPFDSLVEAARQYLKLARDGMCTVFFVDKRNKGAKKLTRVQERLEELRWASF